MIKNKAVWEKWERDYRRGEDTDINRNFRLLAAMYEEARALKKFPSENLMEGFEIKIKLAKALNVSKTS